MLFNSPGLNTNILSIEKMYKHKKFCFANKMSWNLVAFEHDIKKKNSRRIYSTKEDSWKEMCSRKVKEFIIYLSIYNSYEKTITKVQHWKLHKKKLCTSVCQTGRQGFSQALDGQFD